MTDDQLRHSLDALTAHVMNLSEDVGGVRTGLERVDRSMSAVDRRVAGCERALNSMRVQDARRRGEQAGAQQVTTSASSRQERLLARAAVLIAALSLALGRIYPT